MTKKEKFLKLSTYEEFDRRREEFRGLKFDKDTIEHMGKIFPEASPVNKEMHQEVPGYFERKD